MSIETRSGYMYNPTKREIRRAMLDRYGDEVNGNTIWLHSDEEIPLVDYNFVEPISYPVSGSNLDDAAGDLTGIETDEGDVLVTNYDANNKPKYPNTNSSVSFRPFPIAKN